MRPRQGKGLLIVPEGKVFSSGARARRFSVRRNNRFLPLRPRWARGGVGFFCGLGALGFTSVHTFAAYNRPRRNPIHSKPREVKKKKNEEKKKRKEKNKKIKKQQKK
jgi:hypothetical protein